MKKIIVFGSLNMDFSIACTEVPKQGETIQGRQFLMNCGGKGANQALAAKKCGGEVAMIGCVGSDAFAPMLQENLKTSGICTQNVIESDDKNSGMALILRINNDNRIIINHGANHHIKSDEIEARLRRMHANGEIKKGDIFIAQLECDVAATERAIKVAKELGLFTIFNPAPAKMVNKEVFAYIDLFILNQSESEFYTKITADNKTNIKKSAEQLLEFGTNAVILTLGALGCVYITNDNASLLKHFDAFAVKPLDTTAAGDTFIGALAAKLALDKSIDEAIRFASAAAALSTLKMGAASSIPTLEEVKFHFKDRL